MVSIFEARVGADKTHVQSPATSQRKNSALEFLEGYKVWNWSQLNWNFPQRRLEEIADYLRGRTQARFFLSWRQD